MRKTLAVLGLFLATATASAQALGQNKFQINGGVGLSGWGVPVYLGADFGVARDVTIGAVVSYRSITESYGYYKFRETGIGIDFNGNYHFNRLLKIPNNFDFYAGATLAYYNWSHKVKDVDYEVNYSGSRSSGIGFGLQVGGRYFFTKNLGLNLQFGGGIHTVGGRLGLTYRFN